MSASTDDEEKRRSPFGQPQSGTFTSFCECLSSPGFALIALGTTPCQVLSAHQILEPVTISSTFLSRLSPLEPLFKISAIGAI